MSRLRLVLAAVAAAAVVVGAGPAAHAQGDGTRPFRASWVDPAFVNTGGPPGPPPNRPLPGGRFTDHGVITFGSAKEAAAADTSPLGAPVVAMAATRSGRGYWMAAADGEVVAYGDAVAWGSVSTNRIHAPIVGMAATPDGLGYWLVDLNGMVFGFGDALYFGSTAGHALAAPIVGMAASPTGHGYWIVGADGSTFTFGDARPHGSMGGRPVYAPIVGMAATPSGNGYWEVASDGGVFGFGDAPFAGSMGGRPLYGSMVGMAATRDGRGYWLVGDDGAVFAFGTAPFFGSNANQVPTPAIAAIVATPDGRGYWLLDPATVPSDFSAFGAPPGSAAAAIVDAARSQLGGNPNGGYFCSPYGPCEEWCALFATWAWEQGGVPIPRYAFTGDIYNWAARTTGVRPPSARPAPGDAVLYGSGPQSTYTSVHVGIVAEVFPDGAITTFEGDAGPGPPGSGNVVVNGPFLPAFSYRYNGASIYGYAAP